MRELKPLSRDAVDAALAKAERYRFLNEPGEAESICLDILAIDATNQAALVILLLALTDQFGESADAHDRARDLLAALESEYRQGLLRRHHRGAARQSAAGTGGRGIELRRVRLACRSNALLRASGVAAPVGQ